MATSSWEAVAAAIDALPLGYAEREPHELGQEFTYGELTVEGLVTILQDAEARQVAGNRGPVRCFLDLGSGTGKSVLSAAALFPVLDRAIGVELSKPRHRIAVEGRESLASTLADSRLLEHTNLIHGDACQAVASIAAADVIWVSNTCFPESLNAELGAVIDDFAHQGALLYSTRNIGCKRRVDDNGALVACKVTWSASHNATVYEVVGSPLALSQLGGNAIVGTPIEQAFARWAVQARTSGQRQGRKKSVCWLLRRDALPAAVAHALLPSVSALQLVEDLYTEEGALLEICAEALADAGCAIDSQSDAFSASGNDQSCMERGLDFQAFQEVCNEYLEIVHGTWTWRLNQLLNCAFCGR